jgi:hypothetical protein
MDFIHRVPNLLSDEFCKDLIEMFEKSNLKHKGYTYILEDGMVKASTKSNSKLSTDISVNIGFIEESKNKGEPEWKDFILHINSKLKIGIDEYIDKFPMLNALQTFRLEGYNIQRYLPGEGFYDWHCENSGYSAGGDRVLAWMIYLNDLTEGGGTDFKLQKHTEKPETGKMLIWPAGWSHMHKGQVSETQTKYIITGWYKHIND